MDAETEFDNAILDNPEDDATRMVYADWLEERGDARGEYIRLEVQRPPDAQKRLNEMRRTLDPDWVRRIGLRRIVTVDDLVFYLRSWLGLGSQPPSWRFGDGLPPGLATIYRELPELFDDGHFGSQDSLCGPNRLRHADGMVTFAWENQGNWSCRFPYGEDDPPVYSDAADVWQSPARGFQKVCDSLNHFLVTMCLQEIVMSAPFLAYPTGRQPFPYPRRELWGDAYYVNREPDHHVFDVPLRNVLVLKNHGLLFGARSRSAMDKLEVSMTYLNEFDPA